MALWMGAAVFVLVVGLLGCSNAPEEPEPKAVESPAEEVESAPAVRPLDEDPRVATVGPVNFYLGDVLKLTREEEMAPVLGMTGNDDPERIRRMRLDTLKRLIDRRLLILESAKHPEWVDDASWEEEVQGHYVKMGPEEIERRRTAAGVTQDEFDGQFRKFVREEMMIRELLAREVEGATRPLETELQARYDQDRDTVFSRPDSWAVYRIERYLDRGNAVGLPALLQDLDQVRTRVAEDISAATSVQAMAERMAPFVRQYSEAEDAQVGYAYIYDTPKVQFDSEFLSRVRTSELGVLSPVFELAGDEAKVGGCFFLAFEHRPGQTVPFERTRAVLEKQMREERTAERRAALFARLEKEFPSEIDEEALYRDLSAPDPDASP